MRRIRGDHGQDKPSTTSNVRSDSSKAMQSKDSETVEHERAEEEPRRSVPDTKTRKNDLILIVLDLDYTLWPFYAEKIDVKKNNINRYLGTPPPPLFDGVSKCLHELKRNGRVRTVLASCSRDSRMCKSLIRRHGHDWLLKNCQIYPGDKSRHLRVLSEITKIPLSRCILFDDCALFRKQAERAGVLTMAVDRKKGMSIELLRKGLTALRQRKMSTTMMSMFVRRKPSKKTTTDTSKHAARSTKRRKTSHREEGILT